MCLRLRMQGVGFSIEGLRESGFEGVRLSH